jgi:hypothetical protein
MTLPRKANHVVHCSCTPHTGAAVRRRSPVECQSYDNSVAKVNMNLFRTFPYSAEPHLGQRGWRDERTAARGCGRALQARSTVLRGGRLQSWEQVRIGGSFRQIRGLRKSGAEKFRPTAGENYSASSPSMPIRGRRLSSCAASRATATAKARFTTGSPAAPTRRCPSSSRCSATSSPTEFIPPGPGLPGRRYRDGRLQRELPSPRLRRESGGVTPTAQMTRAIECRRAEVQGCAAIVEGRGRRPTEYPRGVRYSSQGSLRKGRSNSGCDDRSLAALGARLVQSRSESRGPRRCAIVASRVDPASRVGMAPSVGVPVTGIPTAPEGSNVLRLVSCSGGAAVARLAHNQEVVGSIPTPATSSGRAA